VTTLQRGATGESVVLLQRLLVRHGYGLNVDGDFGPITETAVRQFKEQAGLSANGIVDSVTWAALETVRPAPVKPVSLIYIDIMMGLGDEATSNGMNVLAAALRALSPRLIIAKKAFSWKDRDAIAARVRQRPKTSRNILIGNSLGANAIPMVTAQCPQHSFDLIVGYDPSWAWTNAPLTRNIKRAIEYRGTNFFSALGKMKYIPAFAGQLLIIDTKVLHSWIDDALDLHAVTIDGVERELRAA
jgi:hypothetical protein